MLRFVPVKLHAEMGPLRTPQPEPEHWQSPSVFSVKHAVTAALSCDDVTVVAGGGVGTAGGVPPPLPPVHVMLSTETVNSMGTELGGCSVVLE
jgi:hypothetical protein